MEHSIRYNLSRYSVVSIGFTIVFLFSIVGVTNAQQSAYNKTKVSPKKINSKIALSKKKVPLFQATNKDIANKANLSSKSKIQRKLPKNTLTTTIPVATSKNRSKLDLTLTSRKAFTSKGYLLANGYFNAVEDEILLNLKEDDELNIVFNARYGKSYLVTLEIPSRYNDFVFGAALCDNPKLIIQMNGVEQTFNLGQSNARNNKSIEYNKLEFVVQSKVNGKIRIPVIEGSCGSRPNLKPKVRFKKVNVKEL